MHKAILWSLAFLMALAPRALADPYADGIADAEAQRAILQNPSVFSDLRVIGAGDLHTLTVDNGSGGNKTIQAVQVTTLTSFVSPYTSATPLQRFVNADGPSDHFRSLIWVTVGSDLRDFYLSNNLPRTDNDTVMHYMQEALGMSHLPNYQALSFWVEPQFLARPSFAPDIFTNDAPDWDAGNSTYTFTNITAGIGAQFDALAPDTMNGTVWQRPFAIYQGPGNYAAWLEQWSTVSYDLSGDRAFPYTGLGWTWDWNTDPSINGFALSEFIVSGGAEFYFASLQQPAVFVPEPAFAAVFAGLAVLTFCFLRRRGAISSGA